MTNTLPTPATAPFPDLPAIAGVSLATAATGQRYQGRDDLLLAAFTEGTQVAGVFTRSATAGAPVEWSRAVAAKGAARGLVVNAGNANAFTGRAGEALVSATAGQAAALLYARPDEILIASTGVIGQPLPPDSIARHLPPLATHLGTGGWEAAVRAIMTTDTFAKVASASVTIDGIPVNIVGIAKGSGMIAPDMATMLGFVFTDAVIAAPALQRLLKSGADRSFNCITVDGDTSTSDTLLLFATGKAPHAPVTLATDKRLGAFRKGLDTVLLSLAQAVVRDGEGASHFVSLTITGATSAQAARRAGLAIANSPLVKTAIAGADANWGRIVMAVGKCGEKADRDRLQIRIGGVLVASEGGEAPGYDETPVAAHMRGHDIDISVDLGVGRGRAQVWTCDLTHGYIDINGSYRS